MAAMPCIECGITGSHRKGCQAYCKVTGKHRIASEQEAQMILTDIKIKSALHGKNRRRETRAYWCHACWGFHLTSKPDTSREKINGEGSR